MFVSIIYSPVRIIHAVSPSSNSDSPLRNIVSEKTINITPPKVGSGKNLRVDVCLFKYELSKNPPEAIVGSL